MAACDFCDTNIGDAVELTGIVIGDTENTLEQFNTMIFVCYTCRIIGRVLDELQGG